MAGIPIANLTQGLCRAPILPITFVRNWKADHWHQLSHFVEKNKV